MEAFYDIAFFDEPDFITEYLLYLIFASSTPRRLRSLEFGYFDLEDISTADCRSYFRFEKNDIVRLARGLQIPDEIRTENRCIVSGK